MTLTVECVNCGQKVHRVERGSLPPFEARVPCRISDCPRRPATTQAPVEQPFLSSMDREALKHLAEIRQVETKAA